MTLCLVKFIKGVNYDSRADKDVQIKKNVKAKNAITVVRTFLIIWHNHRNV